MKINIDDIRNTTESFLIHIGFDKKVAGGCVENIIAAEIAGKKTHGLIRCIHLKSWLDRGKIETSSKKYKIIAKSAVHLHVDGNYLPGFYAINESLKDSINCAKKSKLFLTSVKNLGITGFIGDYARKVAESDLIYIGFHNSQGGLTPYGSKKDLWGTDPITFGIPSGDLPVIFDAASTKITWGELMLSRLKNKKLPEDVAIDANGNLTLDANKAVSLLPFFGRKGSGFAMMVELLAGVLTDSGVGGSIPGGWVSFYMLIDPNLFKPINEYKKDVFTVIKELKSLPRAKGVKEIFFPGEQSGILRKRALKSGIIDVDDEIYNNILNTLNIPAD